MKSIFVDFQFKLRQLIKQQCIALLFCLSIQANAATINVNSVGALQSAINSAKAGDILVLANGTYTNNTINLNVSNITVKAATSGGVYLNGTNAINISGDNNTFSGFQFRSGSITGIVITVTGSYNNVTELNFNGYSAQKYITLISGSQYNVVSNCNFENKPATAPIGNLIHIDPSATVPGYHRIRHCSFQNMPGLGGDNGNECIRISNGATSTYISRTIVEYCYFNNTGLGDSEAISNKCKENVIRYNTCVNNQNAMFCFRNGDNCIAYGNFFIGSGGIRVKEANNIYCYNNYFENSGVGGTMGSVLYVYYTANTTNVLNNINFIHNTFVDCAPIDFDTNAASNTWANNIFKNSSGNIFTGSASGISFAGNIYNGTLGISIPSGMTNTDPKLIKNNAGFNVPSSTSPAIDAASANYPTILDIANVDDDPTLLKDISGLPRPVSALLKDVGCSESTTGTSTNHPLSLSEVGPSYLSMATYVTPIKEMFDFRIYPNPASSILQFTFEAPITSVAEVRILDFEGRVIKQEIYRNSSWSNRITETLNISDLSDGVYFLMVTSNNFSRTQKLVVRANN